MWPADKPTGAMRSSSFNGRPWTPPEIDSDCFPDIHTGSSTPPLDTDGGSLQSEPAEASPRPKLATSSTEPTYTSALFRPFGGEGAPGYFRKGETHTPSHSSDLVDAPAHDGYTPYTSDPITPIQTPWSSGLLQNDGMPQYPYTPESIRTTKSHATRPLSPLPSMPWDADSQSSETSPVQHALSSCVTHLENLIQTREPNDEQMEYLVSKFEEMARFLSAPDAQSKQTDEHLFSELEASSEETGLGITSDEATNGYLDAQDLALSQGYVLEVGRYIESVKKNVKDLTTRMDEVKQLNSIQFDIIGDLRRELTNKSSQLKQEKVNAQKKQRNTKKIPPQRNGFWSAIGEALDIVGEMLNEW